MREMNYKDPETVKQIKWWGAVYWHRMSMFWMGKHFELQRAYNALLKEMERG